MIGYSHNIIPKDFEAYNNPRSDFYINAHYRVRKHIKCDFTFIDLLGVIPESMRNYAETCIN